MGAKSRLVFALQLMREGDYWMRPSEDYATVARLRRDADRKPIAIEIKNEYLRDYLCARGYILRITWYRVREVIVDKAADVGSPKEKRESVGAERFKLRVCPLLEGAVDEGKFAVLNLARTDVDPEEDVPVPGPVTSDNVRSKSWRGEHKGNRYFKIVGELWRDEEIDQPDSPRYEAIRSPRVSPILSMRPAQKMTSEELDDEDSARWLWFKPSIILELLKHRGTKFLWYTGETGGVGCGPGSLTHFGLNDTGLITVYAYDIAKLDLWKQRIWSGYNTRRKVVSQRNCCQRRCVP